MGNRGSRNRRPPAPRLRRIRFVFELDFVFYSQSQNLYCMKSFSAESQAEHQGTIRLTVMCFSASSSGAYQDMEPILKEFTEKYEDVDFIMIDVDEIREAAQKFGIQTTPTFILVKDGNEVDRLMGADQEELAKKIEKHIVVRLLP